MASTMADRARVRACTLRAAVLASQHVEELLSTRVAAAQDERHALSGQLLPKSQGGGEGCRTCRLDEVARHLDHQRLRRADLVVADEDEVIERLAEDSLRELERRARGETLGEGLHPVLDEPALLPRAERGRCALRLHA